MQPLDPALLPRPDQAFEPTDIVVAGRVERVEVDSLPPDHLGHPAGQWHRALEVAGQDRRLRVGAGDHAPVVVVAVAVDQQREPRRPPHLDQRQRLGEPPQRREDRGATRRFVGLGAPLQHHLDQPVVPVGHQVAKVGHIRDSVQQKACGGEDQVRLALLARQAGQEAEDGLVVGDRQRKRLIRW